MDWRRIFKALAPVSFVLRVIMPPLIFLNPVMITVMAVLLDWTDGAFYYQWKIKRITYNLIDKSLDLYWYAASLFYAYKNLSYFKLLVFLFLLRLIGHIIFYIKKNDQVFIYFPNIYEFLFIFVLFCERLGLESKYLSFPNFIYTTLILILAKMAQEIYAHKYAPLLNNKVPEWARGPDR